MAEFDRLRTQNRRVLQRLHDSAIHQAGGSVRGVAGNQVPAISSVLTAQSEPDADGNTIEGTGLWGIDVWSRAKWAKST